MSDLSPLALPVIGLILALWTVAAAYMIWQGLNMRARARRSLKATSRMSRLIDAAPAIPVIVRGDGRIDASEKLQRWLGLDNAPQQLTDLFAGEGRGLGEQDLKALSDDVRTAQKGGKSFRRALAVQGTDKRLIFQGGLADAALYPNGAALLWVFDASEAEFRIAQAEARQQEAERAFEALSGLIEMAPFPMWHRGPDLRLSLVNSAYVDAVGAASAEQAVRDGVELIETVGDMSPISAAAEVQSTGEAMSRDIATTMHGERRQVRVVDVPLGEAGIAGYAIDQQQLADMAREYRQFEAAQRQMLDNISAGVAQFDAERSLIFTNLPFRRLFAMKDEWLAQQPDFARFLDRIREAGRAPEVRDSAEWRQELEGWFLSPDMQEDQWHLSDGSHIRLIAIPVPGGGLLLIFEDRTEQVQLASARDTLLRVRTASFDNLFEAVAVFASDGQLTLWNRRFSALWDLADEDLDGHPRLDTFVEKVAGRFTDIAHGRALAQTIGKTMAERKQRAGRLSLKSGAFYEYAAIPLPDGNVLLTMLDISDSRRVEQALRDRNEALSEASEIKSSFLANMGYELRTPLTSIAGFAELLKAGIGGKLEQSAEGYVDAISEASERLRQQIEAIMDFSQSEAGALPIAKEVQPIAPLLEDLAGDYAKKAKSRGVSLRTDIRPSIGKAPCDARRLTQAVSLILDNALGYTGEKGEVLLYADGMGGAARIIISDNGPGMDAKAQARAFDGFARQHIQGAEKGDVAEKGGLGLPLARRLIEAHGGTLELVSEPGEGTMVTISVPRG